MSIPRHIAQTALDALESVARSSYIRHQHPVRFANSVAAADELRAALTAPPPEPIGEVVIGEQGFTKGWTVVRWRADLPPIAAGTKLYTDQPPRQPLTLEYIDRHIGPDEGDREAVIEVVRQVERAHGIGVAL